MDFYKNDEDLYEEHTPIRMGHYGLQMYRDSHNSEPELWMRW
jgi:hypothetical protein